MTPTTFRSSFFNSSRRPLAAMVMCFALAASSAAQAQASELLNYIPPGSNSVVIVDVQGLLSSQLAQQQGWADRQAAGYSQRPVLLPADALNVVIGAQLDTAGDLSLNWEVAALTLNRVFSADQIALPEGGYIDTIGGVSTVWTPSNAYILDLEGNDVGMMYPADRQAVARWIDFMGSNQSIAVSDYLREAVALVGPETQIVIALDLKDALTPHRVREGMMSSQTFMMNDYRIDRLVPIVTGVRGITLKISVGQDMRGELRFDFSEDVSPFYSQAKDFVLEVLARHNATLDDIESWNQRNEENSIVLEGPLSDSGLRRLATLLDMPTTKFSDLADAAPAEQGTDEYTAASVAYFQAVKVMLDDLREEADRAHNNACVWMERYARRIDALPILNVDDELLDWGSAVSETLRTQANVEKTANVTGGVRVMEANQYSGYTYDNYGYANGGYYDAIHERHTIRAQEQGAARITRFGTWSELENATADMRRGMTQKYGIEF